jgi:hypothetical protein
VVVTRNSGVVFSFFYVETIRGSTYISRAERCQMRRKIGFQVMWNDFSRKKLETRSLRTFFTADHLLAPRPPLPRHLPITAALTTSVLEWRLRPNFAISRISSRLVLITHLTHSHRDTLIYFMCIFQQTADFRHQQHLHQACLIGRSTTCFILDSSSRAKNFSSFRKE